MGLKFYNFTGHGQNTHYAGGSLEKMGNVGGQAQVVNVTNQQMMTPPVVSTGMVGPTVPISDMQQLQQPWNPKNANEVLNPNTVRNYILNTFTKPVQ